jgi:hypothetical protein
MPRWGFRWVELNNQYASGPERVGKGKGREMERTRQARVEWLGWLILITRKCGMRDEIEGGRSSSGGGGGRRGSDCRRFHCCYVELCREARTTRMPLNNAGVC